MHKKGLISVIVPVYNVADFLSKCIDSIVTQTYECLEIILVDDGSPDDSPSICDDWALKDTRIRVIHKDNGGLSDARNTGIESSKGEFVLLVDGDDYIAPNMCESLMIAIEKSNADVAIGGFYWKYQDYTRRYTLPIDDFTIIDRDNILETWVKTAPIGLVVAWNKLYRKKVFFTDDNIRYPLGRLHEDEFTTYRLLYAAERVVFIDKPLYYYVQHEKSIMSNYGERNLRDYADAVHGYIEWCNKYVPEKRKVMECMTMRNTIEVVKRCAIIPELDCCKQKCLDLQEYANCEVRDFLSNPYALRMDKIKYILYKMGIYAEVEKVLLWLKKRKIIK